MEKIVEKLLKGEKGAVTRFYRQYAGALKGYLGTKLPEQDVDEILQDVFMSALDSLPLFRGKSSLKTWLYSIARHEVADYYRKRYVRRMVEKTSKLYEHMAEEMETPEFVYYKNRLRERFDGALSRLSGKYRKALHLRYEMGMSVKEVARNMKLTNKAAESLIYRARMAFIEEYEEIGA